MSTNRRCTWVREQQLAACLGNVSDLCASQLHALAHTCQTISSDPRYTAIFGPGSACIVALSHHKPDMAMAHRGDCVLQLTVAQRVVRRLLEEATVMHWLARHHPDALAVFIAISDLALSPRASEEMIGLRTRKPQTGPHKCKRPD